MMKYFFILVLCLTVNTLFASNKINAKNELSYKNGVRVLCNEFEEVVVVRIINKSGKVVYKEIYNQKGTNRKLCSYNALEPGKYILNIKTKSEDVSRKIYLDNLNQISFKD